MGRVACVAAGLLVLALAAVGAVSVTRAPAAQDAPPKPAGADAPKAAPAGKWITFLSHRTGYNVLYRMRPDGSDVRPVFGGPLKDVPGLTPGVTLYREPHWTRQSPDGQWFLSWAWDRGRPDEKYAGSPHFLVRVGSLDGGPTRLAAPDADEEFAWAPDSKRFAFAVHSRPPAAARDAEGRVRGTEIRLAGIDGSGEMTVLEKPGAWNVCDWSPDGKKLLLRFASALSLRYGTRDLIEYDLEAALRERKRYRPGVEWASTIGVEEHLRVLTAGQAVRFFIAGRYSPDGKRIATTISRHLQSPTGAFDPKGFELAVFEPQANRLRVLAKYPEGLRGPICWSPDGSEIVFSRYLEAGDQREKDKGGLGLWAVPAEGGKARFLTTGWSPDWR